MIIFAIDPGRITGVCLFNTDTGCFYTYEIDARNQHKEFAGSEVLDSVRFQLGQYLPSKEEVDVVLEDFHLRPGQAVDIVPMYILGVVDSVREWETFKYMPSAHKTGNKAYDLKHMMEQHEEPIGAGHTTDALSLALHHWKKIDTKSALEYLEGYKK